MLVRIRGRLPINKSSDPREFRVLHVIAGFEVELQSSTVRRRAIVVKPRLGSAEVVQRHGLEHRPARPRYPSHGVYRANLRHSATTVELAQWVEQRAHNSSVMGSTPMFLTWPEKPYGKPKGCGSNPPAGDGIAQSAVTPRVARRVGSLRRIGAAARHSTGGAGIRMSSSPGSRPPQRRSSQLFGASGTGSATDADPATWCQVSAPVRVGVIAPIHRRETVSVGSEEGEGGKCHVHCS